MIINTTKVIKQRATRPGRVILAETGFEDIKYMVCVEFIDEISPDGELWRSETFECLDEATVSFHERAADWLHPGKREEGWEMCPTLVKAYRGEAL